MASPHPGSHGSLKVASLKQSMFLLSFPLRKLQVLTTPCQESGTRTKYLSYDLSQVANNTTLNNGWKSQFHHFFAWPWARHWTPQCVCLQGTKKRACSCQKKLTQWVQGWYSNSALQRGHTFVSPAPDIFPALYLSLVVESGGWGFSYHSDTVKPETGTEGLPAAHLPLFLLSGRQCLTWNSPVHVLMSRYGFYGHA